MFREMLKSKIHRARITEANLYYEGSITIDTNLMKAADLREFEKVSVVNINNGERFETYVINGRPGSGVIGLNGAAARKGAVGDEIIIISYQMLAEDEFEDYEPKLILVDGDNEINKKTSKIGNKTFYSIAEKSNEN